MRDIKFRAWDIESPAMLDWDEIQDQWESEGYHPAILSNDHYISMQFTGLQDKNNLDIYEGDKLHVDGILQDDFTVEVKWDTGSFSASKPNTTKEGTYFIYRNLAHWAQEGVEVIGNIYENPELLEKT